jgi:hypothetical protein
VKLLHLAVKFALGCSILFANKKTNPIACTTTEQHNFFLKKKTLSGQVVTVLTKCPVWHGRGTANHRRVLVHHGQRRRPGEEVEIKQTSDDLVLERGPLVEDVHPVAVKQQNGVRDAAAAQVPEVHVHRVRAVEVGVELDGGDVRGVERVRVVGPQPDAAGLRVLAEPVQRRLPRQRRRHLQVLVLEHQRPSAGVEERLAGGLAVHREPEGVAAVGEHQLLAGVLAGGEVGAGDVGAGKGRGWLPWEEVVGDLPPLLVGIGDLHPYPVPRLVPA